MDRGLNPYLPGAGARPPELVGRDEVLDDARVLFARVKRGRPERGSILTGLRGVGKTVLLNEIGRLAEAEGYRTVALEASEEKGLAELLAPEFRTLLYDLDRIAGAGRKARRALGVLKSFLNGLSVTVNDVSLGLNIEPELGTADSGDIESDLTALFVAVGEAAQERGTAVALLIDELQYLDVRELGALIMAIHRIQQKALPLVFVGAGLPTLLALAGNGKSYAERLFRFPEIGALSQEDTATALREPARDAGVEFEEAGLDEVFRLTGGYPYFVQEWGYTSWNVAEGPSITLATVRAATGTVISRLDREFFRVRFDRRTPREKEFLRAMAELGSGSYRTGEIAATMRKRASDVSTLRDQLIKKGMVYSPEHGKLAFTVPLFDEFMKRAML